MGKFRIKKVILLLISLFICILKAPSIGAVELPSMKTILDAQYSCEPTIFKQLGWSDSPGIGNLAVKSWAIVSDFSIVELPGRKEPPASRKFKVKFKGWGMIFCGVNESTLPDKLLPQDREFIFNVRERSKTDSHLFLSIENADEIEPPLFLLTPTEDGRNEDNGLTCLVDKARFLGDPRIIDVNKLCKGESQFKRNSSDRFLKALQSKLK